MQILRAERIFFNMQLNSTIASPQVQKPLPMANTTVQAVVASAAVSGQTSAPAARTQTVHAASATGKSEGSRSTQSGTSGGQSVDTAANAFTAQANGAGGARRRGMLLDVTV